jgi:hypothetical protein
LATASCPILNNEAAIFGGIGRGAPVPKGGQYIVLPIKFHIAVYAQWNASIQHDFPHGWQVQLQYIGSKGTHEEYG